MNPPRPALRALAEHLLAEELGAPGERASAGDAAEEVFRRLRNRLSALIGLGGFEALLGRTLKLARAEAPALRSVEAAPGGGLLGLAGALAGSTEAEAIEATTRLLARFLELLATFIGADLASRLVTGIRRRDDELGRGEAGT